MENYIERMKLEKAELEQRITKLLAFMESDEFGKLDDIDKRLLRQQYAGMETYLIALSARLLREDIKRYEGEMQKFNVECSELKAQGKSDEEIAELLKVKAAEMSKGFEDMVGGLPWLLMGGMMFGKMQKPQS